MPRTYYSISTPIEPAWTRVQSTRVVGDHIVGTVSGKLIDALAWKTEPHIALANLDTRDVKTVRMFIDTYGQLVTDAKHLPGPEEEFEVDLTIVGFFKERLVNAWRSKNAMQLWFPEGPDELQRYDLPLGWGNRGIQISCSDVWTYLRILASNVIESGRARVCKNIDCPTPYFIAVRNNKTYCSRACASATSVRNFRKRWAKKKKRRAK
jgi:hypothetical protein